MCNYFNVLGPLEQVVEAKKAQFVEVEALANAFPTQVTEFVGAKVSRGDGVLHPKWHETLSHGALLAGGVLSDLRL